MAMRLTLNLFCPLTVCTIETSIAIKPTTAARNAKVGFTQTASISDNPASRVAPTTVLPVLALGFDRRCFGFVETKLHDLHTCVSSGFSFPHFGQFM